MTKRILVIEDEQLITKTLKKLLTKAGYAVTIAQSGQEAIEIIKANDFDLIITDLKMPGMSGFELSAYVRNRNKFNKHTPILLLTTENISKEEARQNGCIAYFSKSDKQRLLSMVRIIV